MCINCRAGVLGRAAGRPHRSKLTDGGGPGLSAVGAMWPVAALAVLTLEHCAYSEAAV